MDIRHRFVTTNGIRMHIAEAGEGPLVVLTHGFPECWYSWRHQLVALAAAGFHAIAPDQRGFGQTDKPESIQSYSMLLLVGDLVGLLDAVGATSAALVGHDLGARLAWNAALLRPDRFKAVAALSVPFRPRSRVRPTTAMPTTDDAIFYQLYYQEPGAAEAEFERDPRDTVRRIIFNGSGDGVAAPRVIGGGGVGMVPRGGGRLSGLRSPTVLPAWITEADIDVYAAEYLRSGFRGPLNWYRNFDRDWELLAAWTDAKVAVPALYMAGDRDMVLGFAGIDEALLNFRTRVPKLQESIILTGCGHWIQQERSAEVNAAIIPFLRAAFG